MKHIIGIALLLAVLPSVAQKNISKKDSAWVKVIDSYTDIQTFGKGDTAWIKGDTVEFSANTNVKFIKIGDDVYQIVKHNPTLEKVQQISFGNGLILPGTRYYDNMPTYPK